LRNAFFNSNEIMEQRVESFKYSVKIESSYFAAGTYFTQGSITTENTDRQGKPKQDTTTTESTEVLCPCFFNSVFSVLSVVYIFV